MRVVVLDDDPTGTQAAHDVEVLLDWDVDLLTDALASAGAVYVLTNTRALTEEAATTLLRDLRAQCLAAAARIGTDIAFVLRGDSTLRGHVFPETEVFATAESLLAFVPAFPAGGRITRDGVHLVRHHGELVPADRTEYAQDPVFGFDTAVLPDYVAQRSDRAVHHVALAGVRAGGAELAAELAGVADGTVLLFDAETDDDLVLIAAGLTTLQTAGRDVVVRSGATLAAELAGVRSTGLLPSPLARADGTTLVVCGSHTAGASAQLAPLAQRHGDPVLLDTSRALHDPVAAGEVTGRQVLRAVRQGELGFLTTERVRSADHDTLAHGERVMSALTTAVAVTAAEVTAVVAKGGITSAEVAHRGLGATRARVRGQVAPGVSVWDLTSRDGHPLCYVVVPGNVGGPDTLTQVLEALSVPAPEVRRP